MWISGATIAAPVAGELISEINVAMASKTKLSDLASVIHAYPSYSIALQQLAADVYYDKLTQSAGFYSFLKRLGL